MIKSKKHTPQLPIVKIAILEDNATLVKGIEFELDLPEYKICVIDDNTTQFLEKIKLHLPNIAIVDLRIWGVYQAGFEVIETMKEVSPKTSVLLFSAYDSFETVSRAVELGVKAFVSKTTYEKPLPEIIKIVSSGKMYYGPYTKVVEDYLQRSGKQTYK